MLNQYNLPWLQQLRNGPNTREAGYNYEPLPSTDWIRLLKLKPGKKSEELDCELEICSIDFLPKYEALSYMWGDRTKSTTIQCNGKPLVITASLGVALKRFRQRFKTRIMWADATCINQADLLERSEQVSLMSTIYANAERILAWIGLDEKGDAEFTFGRMSQINEWLEMKWACCPPNCEDWERNDIYTALVFKLDHRLLQGDRVKSAFEAFFQRPYFVRAWVQQEIGLAKDVDIFWGEWTISWQNIRRCIWYLSLVRRYHGKHLWMASTIADRDHSYGFFDGMSGLAEVEAPKFSWILSRARYLQVGDPRDLIFSLLSHPAATRSDGSHIIKADYTKSLGEIMWDLTAALIINDLGILWAVFHNDNSLRSVSPSLLVGTVTHMKAISKINEARSAITLRGLLLDRVHSSAPPFGDLDFDSEVTSQLLLQLTLDFVQRDKNHCRYSDQNCVLLSSLVLVAGKRDLQEGNQQANFYAYCREFSLSPAVSSDLMSEASVTGDQILGYSDRGNSREYKTEAWAACYQSKMFRTAKGYLGLGPEILKAGDIVAVIFGAKVPFILRPEGDHYLLVGDCYVHGVMQGEAVEEWVGANPETLEEMDFEIQ